MISRDCRRLKLFKSVFSNGYHSTKVCLTKFDTCRKTWFLLSFSKCLGHIFCFARTTAYWLHSHCFWKLSTEMRNISENTEILEKKYQKNILYIKNLQVGGSQVFIPIISTYIWQASFGDLIWLSTLGVKAFALNVKFFRMRGPVNECSGKD